MSDSTVPTAAPDVDVYDLDANKVGTITLPDAWFGGDVNVPLVHQVVTAQLANARTGSAQTKTRTSIRGGGRKPWRQKGTGRARHGSIRSPIWVGGAVAHGRSANENHSRRVNKKMKRLALRSALSDLARNGGVSVVRGLAFPQPKTKRAVELLARLGHEEVKRVLVVLASNDEPTVKSFRNLSTARTIAVDQLNTYDVVRADVVLFEERAIELIGSGKRGELPAAGVAEAPAPDAGDGAEDEDIEATPEETAAETADETSDDATDEMSDETADETADEQEDETS